MFSEETSPETHAIIGAAIEGQSQLGTGLLESAHGDALEFELCDRGVPFQREVVLPLPYKGRRLRTRYRADFVGFDRVIVELKAASTLMLAHEALLIHYLVATGKPLGLLLNFASAPLQARRFVADGRLPGRSADSVDSAAGRASDKRSVAHP